MMASASLVLARLALVSLFLLGVYTIQIFARTNDTFALMEASLKKNVLPHDTTGGTTGRIMSTDTHFDPVFTGVGPVDQIFGFVLMFFWPIVDGSSPGLSLVSLAFGGQTVASWTLTMLEGVRQGNKWRLVSFVACYGMGCQLFGMGVIAPVYFLLHLTSATSRPTAKTLAPAGTAVIATIPASMTLAYIVPFFLVSLSAPDVISLRHKIDAHNIWQLFPLGCYIAHFVLSTIWPYNTADPTAKTTIKHLRTVYKFALVFAVPAHLATVTLSATAYLLPALFQPRIAAEFHPANVFVPPFHETFAGAKATTIAQGALWFIKWDYALATLSYLVWTLLAHHQGTKAVGEQRGFAVPGLARCAARVLVLGPAGAAVAYVWERDEAVFAAAASQKPVKYIQ